MNLINGIPVFSSDPMTDVYLLFYQSISPVFSKVNLLLQRGIHFLRDAMESLLKKLLGRCGTISVMDSASSVSQLLHIQFSDLSNQLSDLDIMVGFSSRQVLRRLLDEVEPQEIEKFIKVFKLFGLGNHCLLTKF